MIAFFGGAAGIVTIATGGKGNVIPGVAITTALMPPLCTAGYGIATGQWLFFLGAFYLFFINTVFISLATYLGVRLMGFEQKQEGTIEHTRRTQQILMATILLTMVPAGIVTFKLVQKSIFNQNVARFVDKELAWEGIQIISQHIDRDEKLLSVAVIGRSVEDDKIAEAKRRMDDYHLADYRLSVIQGTQSDSLLHLVGQLQTSKADYTETALQQNRQIHELEVALNRYETLSSLSEELRPELQVLYPRIQSLALARTMEVRTDTSLSTPVILAVVKLQPRHPLSAEQTQQLGAWLKARTTADSLRVVVE